MEVAFIYIPIWFRCRGRGTKDYKWYNDKYFYYYYFVELGAEEEEAAAAGESLFNEKSIIITWNLVPIFVEIDGVYLNID